MEAFHNVNNVSPNFDMKLGWLYGLRSEERMLLGYICDDCILNSFLKYSSCRCQEKIP